MTARFCYNSQVSCPRACWNRQTGKLEVLVSVRSCGFKSHRSHQKRRDTRSCASSFLVWHFCCAKVVACGRMTEREWGNPQRFPPHTPPSLRYVEVRTTKPVGSHRKATLKGGFSVTARFCYNSQVSCPRACWNRQTGKLEVLVSVRSCGFKSHRSHQKRRDTRSCASSFWCGTCCAKVVACRRMTEREWETRKGFPPHPSLRYADD